VPCRGGQALGALASRRLFVRQGVPVPGEPVSGPTVILRASLASRKDLGGGARLCSTMVAGQHDMRLKRLEIRNYKSLRDVVIEPTPLTVLVGPNAAGKSNFADALDFLGEVYRWDLEGAVSKKGGYENICYRHSKRSSAPIRFRVVLEVQRREEQPFVEKLKTANSSLPDLVFDHAFELVAKDRRFRSPFSVNYEELIVNYVEQGGDPSRRALQIVSQDHALRSAAFALLEEDAPWLAKTGPLARKVEEIFSDRAMKDMPPCQLLIHTYLFTGREL